MAGRCILVIVLMSVMVYLTLAADFSPPKITELWHGGMSANYGNQPVEEYAIDSRQAAVFTCDADGIPEPVFIWTKNGTAISAGGRVNFGRSGRDLSISSPSSQDNGLYQCNATSSRGTALSQEISAILAFMDPFTDLTSKSFTLRPNERVVLECKPPKSFPQLTITWAKKTNFGDDKFEPVTLSSRISQSEAGDLVIGNVVTGDVGFYVCQVNNDILSKIQDSPAKRISVSGTATGPRNPEWVSYPDSRKLAVTGSDVSLKCIADGFPTPEIVWVGVPEDDERFTTASFSQEIIISNVQLGDADDYMCVAVSGDNEISKSVELIVEAAPSWVSEPEDAAIAPGETANITCEATGVPTPDISWLINGAEPPPDARRTISGNTVTLADATTDDNSVYQCVAENMHGKIMADALLSVNVVNAEIVDPPEVDKPAAEGESVTLQCGHIGRPYPDVTWEGKSGQISNDGKYTINEDGSLTISNVAKEDEGSYTCKVANKGAEDTKEGSIVFRTKTTIVVGVEDATVNKPIEATLTCSATKDARADIAWSWTANDVATDDVSHDRFRYNTDRSNMVILKTKVSDTGEYCCIASTTYDSDKSCGTLTVQDVPSAPYDVLAFRRGDTATTISWQPSNPKNSPIIEYIIEYNTTYVGVPWQEIKRVSSPSTSSALDLAGGITYFFRVTAVNGVGRSDYSDVSNSITTPPSAPATNPSNVVGQSEDPDTMVISWDPMDVTQYGGDGFMYQVEYKNKTASGWTVLVKGADVNSVTITDTKVYQEFQIKVTAINDIGPGPTSEVVTGYSGEGTPESPPGNVEVNVTSPTSASVSFDPVTPESLQGKFKYYRVYYTEAMAQVSGALKSVECMESPCNVDGLKPSTDYELHVVVANSMKEGPRSPINRFKTPEAPPGQPLNFDIVMLSKKMKLYWFAPNKGGDVDSYTVKYSPLIGTELGASTDITLGPTQTDCIIEGLTPETTYRVSIQAENTAGYGMQDFLEKATRKSGVPLKPTGVDVKSSKDEAAVTWPEDKTGPAIEKYIVKYKKKDDTEWTTKEVHVFDRNLGTNLTELSPDTTYQVQIVAMNEDNEKTEGSIITFTTTGAASPVSTSVYPGSTPVVAALADDGGLQFEPWLIVMICLILLLLIILLILCYVRSQKGGKYNVSDKEDKLRGDPESAPLKDDEGGFEEYKPKGPESNLPLHVPEEESSDEDSLAGYADGITGNFDEDGSFIGQYSDKRKKAEEAENNAMQSLV